MSFSITAVTFTALAFLGGIASATQSLMNGTLGRNIGDPVAAALWSFATGTVLVLCLHALRGGNISPTVMASTPGWSMLGGMMGLMMVLGIIVAVPKVGILTTVIAVVLGQIVAALLFDGFGLLGQAQQISPARVLAVLLVVSGLVLSKI